MTDGCSRYREARLWAIDVMIGARFMSTTRPKAAVGRMAAIAYSASQFGQKRVPPGREFCPKYRDQPQKLGKDLRHLLRRGDREAQDS